MNNLPANAPDPGAPSKGSGTFYGQVVPTSGTPCPVKEPDPGALPSGGKMFLVTAGLAAAGAGMAILALPGYEQWYLGFVAWAPLLFLVVWAPGRWGIPGVWGAGFAYFLGSMYWLELVTGIGWVALAFYLSLYFLVFAAVCRWLSRGRPHVPFVVAAPVVWVGMEFLRSATWTGPEVFLFTGLPWQLAGHALYRRLALIQIADTTGVYGVSFVVMAVNAWAAWGAWAWATGRLGERRERVKLAAGAGFAAALVAGTAGYGWYRLAQYEPQEGPRICVVQGNIPNDLQDVAGWKKLPATEQWEETSRLRERLLSTYLRVTRECEGEARDLLVWPETSVPGPIEEDAESWLAMEGLCRESKSYVLVGTCRDAGSRAERQWRNSAYYYAANGERLGVYDKIHLVPFGEYIPMVERLPWLQWFMPPGYDATNTPGRDMTLFRLPKAEGGEWTFGTPICFEDTMPYLVRRMRRRGTDFIVNLTNDGWFRATREMDQHLAISVFRAVENRVGLVRAANTGISAIIEPNGRVEKRLEDARGRFREVSGTLVGRVKIDGRKTLYTQQEDIFAVMCLGWVAVFAGFRVGLGGVGRRREFRHF